MKLVTSAADRTPLTPPMIPTVVSLAPYIPARAHKPPIGIANKSTKAILLGDKNHSINEHSAFE